MNFLAVGLCIEISTGLLYYYYMKLHNAQLLKTSSKRQQQHQPVTMDLDNTAKLAKAVDHVKIESIIIYIFTIIMGVGSNRLSFIHVRLYVSDEIQQLILMILH